MDMSGIGLTPFYRGKCRLEIGQVGSELGVSTVNPESEGLGRLCVQSAPPLQAAGKGCLLGPTGRILRVKGRGSTPLASSLIGKLPLESATDNSTDNKSAEIHQFPLNIAHILKDRLGNKGPVFLYTGFYFSLVASVISRG